VIHDCLAIECTVLYITNKMQSTASLVRQQPRNAEEKSAHKCCYYRRSEVLDRIENIFLRISDGGMNAR
jgi:hypothetical protein